MAGLSALRLCFGDEPVLQASARGAAEGTITIKFPGAIIACYCRRYVYFHQSLPIQILLEREESTTNLNTSK